ncbi:hypothetical protein H632_c126p2 [Helicosporidium sp. ATCC 50920]|nr:hypothetical protein H632_c126p2 [Helicosporidium sp. ATCC 50920]|eukprot:KDD76725.1 hypothetical protein H632_c126p2 [Helicosporidium sp. ATCC 50920]
MGAGSRLLDVIIAVFLFVHIPITILLDAQAVFPRSWFHPTLIGAHRHYLLTYRDPLMTPPYAPWFLSLVWTEMVLQLPFFFAGAYAFIARKNWIRIPAVAYSSFVLATMCPILAELWQHRGPGYARYTVLSFYAPWALFPLLIFCRTAFKQPFPAPAPADPWGHMHKHKWI